MKKNSRKPTLYILIATVLLGISFYMLPFFSVKTTKNQSGEENSRRLLLNFVEDISQNSTKYDATVFDNSYTGTIQYYGFDKVTIRIEDNTVDFLEAIKMKIISVEELIAYARLDAQNGFCLEKKESEHGLTTFSYHYDDCDLTYIDDIYETPDGKQHHIQHLGIYPSGKSYLVSHSYYTEGTAYPIKLDREDWGLTLEVIDTTTEGATVKINHQDGQQIGSLEIIDFSVYASDRPLFTVGFENSEHIPISKNGVTEVALFWGESNGSLTSGEYLLVLNIEDIYDPSDVHPLMQNFYDTQRYYTFFIIS